MSAVSFFLLQAQVNKILTNCAAYITETNLPNSALMVFTQAMQRKLNENAGPFIPLLPSCFAIHNQSGCENIIRFRTNKMSDDAFVLLGYLICDLCETHPAIGAFFSSVLVQSLQNIDYPFYGFTFEQTERPVVLTKNCFLPVNTGMLLNDLTFSQVSVNCTSNNGTELDFLNQSIAWIEKNFRSKIWNPGGFMLTLSAIPDPLSILISPSLMNHDKKFSNDHCPLNQSILKCRGFLMMTVDNSLHSLDPFFDFLDKACLALLPSCTNPVEEESNNHSILLALSIVSACVAIGLIFFMIFKFRKKIMLSKFFTIGLPKENPVLEESFVVADALRATSLSAAK